MKNWIAGAMGLALVACGSDNENYLESGKQSIEQQSFSTAVIQLKNAVRQQPEDAESRYFLAVAYMSVGDVSGAEKEFERALDLGYDANEVVPNLTKLYQSKGNKKGIHKLVAKAKGTRPQVLAELKLSQAKVYVEAGEHEKAQAVLDELKEIPGSGEFGLLGLAYSFVIKNNIDAALVQLDNVLERYPNQQEALRLKGRLLLANAQKEKAANVFVTYTQQYPNDVNSKALLARLYMDLDKPEQADELFNELAKAFPKALEIATLQANTKMALRQYEQANQAAERALLINSEDVTARLIAGVSSYFLNNHADVNRHLSLVAGLLPESHPAIRILADSQLKLGQSLDASETLTAIQGADLNSGDALLMTQVGRGLVVDGQLKKAKQILSEIPENVEQPESLVNLGLLKLSMNDVSGVEDLELATEKLDKQPLQLQQVLAIAYLKSNQLDKALELAEQMIAQSESQVQGFLLKSRVALIKGQRDESLALLQQAAELAPNNANIQLALALVPSINNVADAEVALNKLEAILELEPSFTPAITQHYGLTKRFGVPQKMTVHLANYLQQNPSDVERSLLYANILITEGQPKKSLEILKSEQFNAELSKPLRETFNGILAQAYIQDRQFDKAFDHYKTWYQTEPSNVNAVKGYTRLLQAQNLTKEALYVTSSYMEDVSSENMEVALLHAQNLVQSNQLEEFQALHDNFSDEIKSLPFVKGLLGQKYMLSRQPKEALPLLKASYDQQPTPNVTAFLVSALNATQGQQVAISFLKAHVLKYPTDAANALRYATLQTYKNNDEAIKYYKKVLELTPQNAIAANNLAHVLMNEGQLNAALKYGEQSLALAPRNPNILDTVAMIQLKLGNKEQALDLLSKAMVEADEKVSDETFVNYIEVLFVNNEVKLAERKLAQRDINDKQQIERLKQLQAQYIN